jgi:hypothetical protein
MQGCTHSQRRWLQGNPFEGVVLDDPTLPLPRFIHDTQKQPSTRSKPEPVALKDALQMVQVSGVSTWGRSRSRVP